MGSKLFQIKYMKYIIKNKHVFIHLYITYIYILYTLYITYIIYNYTLENFEYA